jgi:hypothetical protein
MRKKSGKSRIFECGKNLEGPEFLNAEKNQKNAKNPQNFMAQKILEETRI